jgi:hypothetical protein
MKQKINEIALEDIATLFVSEFVKNSKDYLLPLQEQDWIKGSNIPFLKMSYNRRRKVVEKVLEKMEQDLKG